MEWDPAVTERSPMLEALRAQAVDLHRHDDWPNLESLQALVRSRDVRTAAGAPLTLVSDAASEAYEPRVRLRAEMHVRQRDWHDLFNVLVWLTYPLSKAALNDAQLAAMRRDEACADGARSPRGPARDALTLFDENGLIVLASNASLLDDIREFRWKRLFWERRQEVLAAMRFFVFGHALCEKALRPYVGMAAHALLFSVGEDELRQSLTNAIQTADRLVSAAIPRLRTPRSLSPIPVLGIPGWWAANENPAFYENAHYFRTGRRRNA
jgi:hypothetical protein